MRQLAADLWVAERPLRFLGVEVGTRMTVVRLPDGDLFVHSPVELNLQTHWDLDQLGRVRRVIAPNRFHHLFVRDYQIVYETATFHAAPGLPEKRKRLAFDHVLGDEPHAGWTGEIDQVLFQGMPLFNEVVFFHRRSRTLILTDLAFNVQRSASLATRLVLHLDGAYGRFGVSRIGRWLVRDRKAARESVERILAWDFDRIILAHGDVVEHGGREAVRTAFAWL